MVAAKLANLGEGRPSKTRPKDRVSNKDAGKLLKTSEKSVS
jgi:hypothetical protein